MDMFLGKKTNLYESFVHVKTLENMDRHALHIFNMQAETKHQL